VGISAEDRPSRDVQADLRAAVVARPLDREVTQLALTEDGGGDGEPGARQIGSDRLFAAIGAYPPDALVRALGPDFLIGVYGGTKGALPFLILRAENEALARAAMLSWEETMAVDLGAIFPIADRYAREVGNQPSLRGRWGDAVYTNRDARVLAQGDREVLLWGFADNGHIVITSEPFLLPEMASRLTRDQELH
jgi:hypothetical protein